MSKCVESGMLVGRPYGGVMLLIRNDLRHVTECLYTADRCVVIRVADWIIINVYMPCKGTDDRQLICQDVLDDVWSWRERFLHCKCLIGGDLNVDLCSNDSTATIFNSFFSSNCLVNCDKSPNYSRKSTYVNNALNHESVIDYIFVSDDDCVAGFSVLDPDINFSDHLPITVDCSANIKCHDTKFTQHNEKQNNDIVLYLRWDHADLVSFYEYTRINLQPIMVEIDSLLITMSPSVDVQLYIDILYAKVINVLCSGAKLYVPTKNKSFYKFWWDEGLKLLKEESINSAKLWKAAGKPRSGAVSQKYQLDRSAYRRSLREHQRAESTAYTNDLHAALANKNAKEFWKSWHSKFEVKSKIHQIDGSIDKFEIASKFAAHFSSACSSARTDRAAELKIEYDLRRAAYYGTPLVTDDEIDVELVDKIITELQRGKAAGLDSLTAEHLQYSHPILCCILVKLFNTMLKAGAVPLSFGCSYTVPLIKVDVHARSLSTNDFRGITISPVISKVFEHCVLQRFKRFLNTSDNQFGFKPGLGCSHAINTVRHIVDSYVKGGSTANICAIDLSKAFDKMNHHALFLKLMNRHLPVELLCILESWFSNCYTCIKWYGVKSNFFKVNIGIRQGGVLSPCLFAIYIDDVVKCVCKHAYGSTLSIVLYADDIILLSPSIQALQILLSVCETELLYLDMLINVKKSCCMRVGQRCNVACAAIVTMAGDSLPWVDEIRYLGIFIVKFKYFKCSTDKAKRSFYRAANAIFGKIGRVASEEVTLELISKKCIPILTYGLEACNLNNTELRSINFPCVRLIMKLFCTKDANIIKQIQTYFNFVEPSAHVVERKEKFLRQYGQTDNMLCRLCTF